MSAALESRKIKVVVCEDQPQILKNQMKILQDSPEVEVIGTALSGEAALELLEKKQPDVLLQDLGLPRMTGIEVTREVKRKWPAVEVLGAARVASKTRAGLGEQRHRRVRLPLRW